MRVEANVLVGSWSGSYKLWLGPDEPMRESTTKATVSTAAAGQFLVITYSWADREKPHDGLLLLRAGEDVGPVDIVWVDSFHTMAGFMQFTSSEPANDGWNAFTKWSAGEGPEWGWRIEVTAPGRDELLVRMYISTPAGEEAPAVESRYTREAGPG